MGSTRAFTLANGVFDANDKVVEVGSFALGAGTKTLTIGSNAFRCHGAFNANTNVANLTVSASAGTIEMMGAGAIFSGGGKTWPTLYILDYVTVQQSNTFAWLDNDATG